MLGTSPSISLRIFISPVPIISIPPETGQKTHSHSRLSFSAAHPALETVLPLHNAELYEDHRKTLRLLSPAIHPPEYAPVGADSLDGLPPPVPVCSFFFMILSPLKCYGVHRYRHSRGNVHQVTRRMCRIAKKAKFCFLCLSVTLPHKQHTLLNPMY